MLFSVRSRYSFAIGLEECLVFAVGARDVHGGYPTPATLELTHGRTTAIRGCHPVSRSVPGDFSQSIGRFRSVRTPHCPKASVWTVSRSLAVTDDISCWFLFLLVLRCFNSERSLLREAIAVGIPIRRSQVLRLRAAPLGLSQLGTSVVGFRAEPSTSWHSSQLLLELTV